MLLIAASVFMLLNALVDFANEGFETADQPGRAAVHAGDL